MSTTTLELAAPKRPLWSAVASMAMCVALLIASEFMPVSLLSPIARDLHATQGMAGQAISVSGLFAVITSFAIVNIAARFDRRHVLAALTAVMLASLVLIALAPNFAVLMGARALLGVTIGGFWSLATATVMRLVPERSVPSALGVLYTGNGVATAFAAPIGSYLGSIIGWRGVFWLLVPVVIINIAWQWTSVPSMPPPRTTGSSNVFRLLRQRTVAFAMLGVMLTFAGAFCTFTYLRPFLETYTQVDVAQLSLLLLALGVSGFAGTYGATALLRRHLFKMLALLPLALAAITLLMLNVGHEVYATGAAMVAWGAVNAAIPVAWSTWLAKGIREDPESGGGLMVGAIQLAIMLGAALGGALLDHLSIGATFIGGAILLVAAAVIVGRGSRIGSPRNERVETMSQAHACGEGRVR
jgi:predicted MFS family arabinose efflux permease